RGFCTRASSARRRRKVGKSVSPSTRPSSRWKRTSAASRSRSSRPKTTRRKARARRAPRASARSGICSKRSGSSALLLRVRLRLRDHFATQVLVEELENILPALARGLAEHHGVERVHLAFVVGGFGGHVHLVERRLEPPRIVEQRVGRAHRREKRRQRSRRPF